MNVLSLYSFADPAEGGVGDAQEGGDMVGGDSIDDIGMCFQQSGVSLFGRKEQKLLGSGLGIAKELLCEQPAKPGPVGMRFIEAGQVAIADIDDLGIFHCLNKIVAGYSGDKTSEGNYKLVLGEEEDIRFFPSFGVTVVYAKDAFDDQPQVVTDHVLQVEEIVPFDLSGLPEISAIGDVFFGECRKIRQVVTKYLMVVIHSCQAANLAFLTVFVKRIAVIRK